MYIKSIISDTNVNRVDRLYLQAKA